MENKEGNAAANAAAAAAAASEKEADAVDDILQLSTLREEGKAELLDILESLRGRKCLVIDQQLGSLLNQIVIEGSKLLKENGVQYFRVLRGELGDFRSDSGSRDVPENIIYLVRPNLSTMSLIAQQIITSVRNGIKSQYHICFVPTQSTVCMHLLEEQINSREIWDKISFGEFRMGLIPFDSDLLSLEIDGVFKQCYVDGDLSSLNIVAMSLLKLQFLFGIIPNVRSKGLGAKKVLQKMMHLRVEEEDTEKQQLQLNLLLQGGGASAAAGSGAVMSLTPQRSEIDTLVILDREVDLVSPLVTPLTYEGLIDEVVGIENGCRIRVDASVVGSSDQQDALSMKMAQAATANTAAASAATAAAAAAAAAQKSKAAVAPGDKITLTLDNNDAIYSEIRDLSIERLGAYLQEKAIVIREKYTTFKQNKDASLSEIHDFVKKIPKLTKDFKALNQHINIAELLKQRTDSRDFREQWHGERSMLEGESYLDAIEELFYADSARQQLTRILRLLCLQSLTAGGVKGTRYDAIRRTVVQLYGFQHLFTLSNLERSGLIKRKDAIIVVESSSTWQFLRKNLRLIDDRVNMSKPNDISYVSAGYAPLLVRLVQLLGNNSGSWISSAGTMDVMKLLPGPVLEFSQLPSAPEELSSAMQRYASELGSNSSAAGASSDSSSGSSFGASALVSAPNALFSYTSGIMSSASDAGSAMLRGGSSNSASGVTGSAMDTSSRGANMMGGSLGGAIEKKTMLIFVVGGLSYLEIAAFRFLSKDPGFPYKILLGTTKLLNGSTFLQSLEHS